MPHPSCDKASVTPPICRDCAHGRFYTAAPLPAECLHPQVATRDLVYGHLAGRRCENERVVGPCGPGGTLFEPKPTIVHTPTRGLLARLLGR